MQATLAGPSRSVVIALENTRDSFSPPPTTARGTPAKTPSTAATLPAHRCRYSTTQDRGSGKLESLTTRPGRGPRHALTSTDLDSTTIRGTTLPLSSTASETAYRPAPPRE